PDFIVHAYLLQHEAGAFMKASEEQAKGDRVQALDVHLCKLQISFVDPYAAVEFRKKFGLFHVGHETRPRLAIDDPCVASCQLLRSHKLEVVSVGHLGYQLACLLA